MRARRNRAGAAGRAGPEQQKLAAAKQAAALNQKALRSYSWVEKTELSLKGEVKNTKVDMCRYGPDGKVQKTPVVEPPAAREAARDEGQGRREEDGGDEGRARGGGGARPAIPPTLPRHDAGGDECRHRVDRSGGPRPRIAQVPGLRQGQRRLDADVRLECQGTAANRCPDLARRARQRRHAEGDDERTP